MSHRDKPPNLVFSTSRRSSLINLNRKRHTRALRFLLSSCPFSSSLVCPIMRLVSQSSSKLLPPPNPQSFRFHVLNIGSMSSRASSFSYSLPSRSIVLANFPFSFPRQCRIIFPKRTRQYFSIWCLPMGVFTQIPDPFQNCQTELRRNTAIVRLLVYISPLPIRAFPILVRCCFPCFCRETC